MTRAAKTRAIGIDLTGLRPAPSQVWGAIRLVPLIRDHPLDDLRLGLQSYEDGPPVAATVDSTKERARILYSAYIPYGLAVSWSDDGRPAIHPDTWLGSSAHAAGRAKVPDRPSARVLDRLIKRESRRSYRMLPLHVAMEGFLALCFGGPDIAWRTWSERSLRRGLSPRVETALPGFMLPDLDEALRIFEIHPMQSGMLVFVGDSFASGFVVSHPRDYRALHATLLQDFYAEILLYHGWHNRYVPSWRLQLDDRGVGDLAALQAELERGRDEWARFDVAMATGLVGRQVQATVCRSHGLYTLYRFMTGFEPGIEQHIGEIMVREDGTTAYLKSYRLTPAQCERGRILTALSDSDWRIEHAARALGCTAAQLQSRLRKIGFAELLRERLKDP